MRSLTFTLALSLPLGLGFAERARAQEYRSQTIAPPPSARIDATSTRTSVSTEDARRGTADTAQIIQREPDVRIRRSGGMNGPAYISIRGSDPEGVRYSLEGTPLHGAGVTTFNVNTILPELISRLDIYRTTVPIQFGNVSTGGVVDFQLRDARRDEIWATAGYGSFGSWKGSVAASIPLEDGHFRIAASMRRTQGNFRFYNTNGTDFNRNDDTPNDVRRNNDATQGGLMLVRDQYIDDWRLRLISITDLWEGGVSGVDVAQSHTARNRKIHQNFIFGLRGDLGEQNVTRLDVTASLQIRRVDYKDLLGEVGVGRQNRTDRQTLGFIAASTTTELPHHLTLSSVADLQMEHDAPRDTVIPHYVYSSARIYPSLGLELKWEHPQELVSIAVGSRASIYYQRNHTADVPIAPEFSKTDFALTPQIGVVVQPLRDGLHRVQLASYASRSHRQPGFDELFGDTGALIGNPNLTAETQNALELVAGWRFSPGTWLVDARLQTWFHWRDNAIEYFALPTGARKPMNIPGAIARGQELSVMIHHDFVTLTAQAAHIYSSSDSDDQQIHGMKLPWRSPWSFTLDGRFRPLASVSGHRLELIGTFRFDDRFYADPRNIRIYPERIETDIGIEFDAAWRNVPSIRLEAYNIFNRRVTTLPGRNGGQDVEVIRPISDFNGYPRAGRSFYVTLTWQLERD